MRSRNQGPRRLAPPPRPGKFIAHFDPNDEPFMLRALETGEPPEVREAFTIAGAGFFRRIHANDALKREGGVWKIVLVKPATVFDRVVINSVLKAICEQRDIAIDAHYCENPDRLGSPEIEFVK